MRTIVGLSLATLVAAAVTSCSSPSGGPGGGQPPPSNDNGDVTWVVPTAALSFPASVPGINYHNWQAAVTPTSTIAHKGMVAGAKVLAGTILDLLTRPELVQAARADFAQKTA